jgi:hypothetical protein
VERFETGVPGKIVLGYKVLFAGGCHVNGEAADGDSKLSSVALRLLEREGIPCQPAYLVPIRLAHPRRLAEKCTEFRPDVLVIQSGYPETADLISQYIKKKLGQPANVRATADVIAGYGGTFGGSWTVEAMWFLRCMAKRLFDAATRHRLVDLRHLNASVDRFFTRVAALGVPHVIVLSPLPCADPVAFFYRRKLAPMLHAAAQRCGFSFLDVIGLGSRSLYLNPYHLNHAGHQVIGQLTGEHIAAALRQRAAVNANS